MNNEQQRPHDRARGTPLLTGEGCDWLFFNLMEWVQPNLFGGAMAGRPQQRYQACSVDFVAPSGSPMEILPT